MFGILSIAAICLSSRRFPRQTLPSGIHPYPDLSIPGMPRPFRTRHNTNVTLYNFCAICSKELLTTYENQRKTFKIAKTKTASLNLGEITGKNNIYIYAYLGRCNSGYLHYPHKFLHQNIFFNDLLFLQYP